MAVVVVITPEWATSVDPGPILFEDFCRGIAGCHTPPSFTPEEHEWTGAIRLPA